MSGEVLLDLGFLTDEERDVINGVIFKDVHMRKLEQSRISRLRKELGELKENGLPEEDLEAKNERYCARCQTYFGIILNKGALCPRCEQKVCKICRNNTAEDEWMCTLCYKVREVKAQSGAWFFQDQKGKNDNLFGSLLLRQSLRRLPGSESRKASKERMDNHKPVTNGIELDQERQNNVDYNGTIPNNRAEKDRQTSYNVSVSEDNPYSDISDEDVSDEGNHDVTYSPRNDSERSSSKNFESSPGTRDDEARPGDEHASVKTSENEGRPGDESSSLQEDQNEGRPGDESSSLQEDQNEAGPVDESTTWKTDDYEGRPGDESSNLRANEYEERPGDEYEESPGDQSSNLREDEYEEKPGDEYEESPGDQSSNLRADEYEEKPGNEYEARPDHDDYEARPGDEYEERPGDEYEARPGDEYEARPGDEYEARPGDEYEARPGDEYEARPGDEYEARPGDEYEERPGDVSSSLQEDENEARPGDESSKLNADEAYSDDETSSTLVPGAEDMQAGDPQGVGDQVARVQPDYDSSAGASHFEESPTAEEVSSSDTRESGLHAFSQTFTSNEQRDRGRTPDDEVLVSRPEEVERREQPREQPKVIITTEVQPATKSNRSSIVDYEEDSDVSFSKYEGNLGNRMLKDQLSMGSRESIMSYYSNAGGEVYGKYPVNGDIYFGIKYDAINEEFQVQIHQARDITAVDEKHNLSDPYVKTYLLPDTSKGGKRKSKVKKRTINPVFDEIIKYKISYDEILQRTLWLAVWNYDRFGHNDFLGEVLVPIDQYQQSGFRLEDPEPQWYHLCERQAEDQLMTDNGEIVLALKYVPPSALVSKTKKKKKKGEEEKGELHVNIIEANNLLKKDVSGFSDPFCKSYLLPDKSKKTKQKTAVVKKNINPKWNYRFVYDNVTHEELMDRVLELTVWDYDRGSSNDFLGGVRIGLGAGLQEWDDANSDEQAAWNKMLNNQNDWNQVTLTLRDHMGNHNYQGSALDLTDAVRPSLIELVKRSSESQDGDTLHSQGSSWEGKPDEELIRHSEYHQPKPSKIAAAMTSSKTHHLEPSKAHLPAGNGRDEKRMTLADLARMNPVTKATKDESTPPVVVHIADDDDSAFVDDGDADSLVHHSEFYKVSRSPKPIRRKYSANQSPVKEKDQPRRSTLVDILQSNEDISKDVSNPQISVPVLITDDHDNASVDDVDADSLVRHSEFYKVSRSPKPIHRKFSDSQSSLNEPNQKRRPTLVDILQKNDDSSENPIEGNLMLGSGFSGSQESVYSNPDIYSSNSVTGDILLAYEYVNGVLKIDIFDARNLIAIDKKKNTSDPYVKVYLLPDQSTTAKRKTEILHGTLDPEFNEEIQYEVSSGELLTRTIWVSVWHYDRFGSNEFLGEVRIPLADYKGEKGHATWYKLLEMLPNSPEDQQAQATLIVALMYSQTENKKKEEPNTGTLYVKVIQARCLPGMDSDNLSDPYCKSYLLPDPAKKTKNKTHVMKRNLNPRWNHKFSYDNLTVEELQSRVLELTVWDHDMVSSNDFLGGVRIGLGTSGEEWDDCDGDEVTLWEFLLSKPNTWTETTLLLRSHMGSRKGLKITN